MSPSGKSKLTKPPFKVKENEIIPKEQIPTDHLGRSLIRYCKEEVHLFSKYYALWDRYYILYNQKVYLVIRVDDQWYIFQKQQNPTTKKWEEGTATRLTPTVFQLNPNLDPFKGDLLQTRVICPIEEELDLLIEQIHEAPEEEPESHQTESA